MKNLEASEKNTDIRANIVLGVWLANTRRDEIMRDIDPIWTDIPDDIKKQAQKPYAPRL